MNKAKVEKPTRKKAKINEAEIVEEKAATEVVQLPSKQVSVQQEQLPGETLIQQAITQGASVETMEKLLAMRKELRAEAAKEAFDEAMANFQRDCPIIKKTSKVYEKNSTTKVRYTYASIDSIVDQVKSLISEHGLSYTLRVKNDEKMLTVTCRVTHKLGHSEESDFTVPISSEQYMSDVQKFGARSTFAKRYAFCNAFGIMTGDGDTDVVEEQGPSKQAPSKPAPKAPGETDDQRVQRLRVIDSIEMSLKGMGQTMTEKARMHFMGCGLTKLQKYDAIYKEKARESEFIPTVGKPGDGVEMGRAQAAILPETKAELDIVREIEANGVDLGQPEEPINHEE
jgi:ERF superfamily